MLYPIFDFRLLAIVESVDGAYQVSCYFADTLELYALAYFAIFYYHFFHFAIPYCRTNPALRRCFPLASS